MYYELYIDVFFLENFMMDSLLLCLVNRIMKCGRPAGRLIAGAAVGSLLACLVVAVPMPGICRMILFHTAVPGLMLYTGTGIRKPGGFIRAYALLYGCAVFTGGMMGLIRPYMRAAGVFYGAAVLAYAGFMVFWKLLARLRGHGEDLIRVSLYTEQGAVEFTALVDTGNGLRDFVTGDPVSVLGPRAAEKIPGVDGMQAGFRLIPYRCVGGDALMRVFRVSRMCVHMEEDKWIYRPLLGIGDAEVSGRGGMYEMLLNPAVIAE